MDIRALEKMVRESALASIARSDVVLLLLSAGEMSPEDEELILHLRAYSKKTLLCVNKTEGGRLVSESYNLLPNGFPDALMISAEHGDGIGALENAVSKMIEKMKGADLAAGAADYDNSVEPMLSNHKNIKLAIVGKPNSGKSTLSNRLRGVGASIVSSIPGTTRDTVAGTFAWGGTDWETLDTAGIRRKSKVTDNVEYYSVNRAIKAAEESDIVILMIDATEGFADQDKKIARFASDRGRGLIIALNKWDEMPKIKNAVNAATDQVRYQFAQMGYAPVIPLSAKNGDGVVELLNTAKKISSQLNRHIETSAFNAALAKWATESPPPTGPSTHFKIRYGTQISANPVKFIVFVSRPQVVRDSYRSYICNKIRSDLGFSFIPVDVIIKK
jgi:GTP-binding protein